MRWEQKLREREQQGEDDPLAGVMDQSVEGEPVEQKGPEGLEAKQGSGKTAETMKSPKG